MNRSDNKHPNDPEPSPPEPSASFSGLPEAVPPGVLDPEAAVPSAGITEDPPRIVMERVETATVLRGHVRALLVLFLACLLLGVRQWMPAPSGAERSQTRLPRSVAPSRVPQALGTSTLKRRVEKERQAITGGVPERVSGPYVLRVAVEEDPSAALDTATLLLGALLMGGGLICLGLGLAWMFSERWRRILELGAVASRAPPELYFLDLLAAVGALASTAPYLGWLLVRYSPPAWWRAEKGGWLPADAAALVASLAMQFLSYALAIAVVFWLARTRGGARGLSGLWPLWPAPGRQRSRNLWGDLKLGLAGYVLFAWSFGAANLLNGWMVKWLGQRPDQNLLLELLTKEARGPDRLWVLAALTLFATIGAAFFEELLFRGVLYNVLRRYVGRFSGAVFAALIFSAAHGVLSNVFSLFLMGLLLTWVYERHGRLLAPVVLHAVNNAVAAVFTILQAYPPGGGPGG